MPDQDPPKLTESATETSTTGAAVQTPVKPTPAKPKHHKLPPYKLLLHNDEFNTMDTVVIRIVKLTPLSAAQARLIDPQKQWQAENQEPHRY